MPSEESSRWFRVGHSKYVKENEIPTPKAERVQIFSEKKYLFLFYFYVFLAPVSPGDEEYKESMIFHHKIRVKHAIKCFIGPISPTPMDLSDLREVEKSSENAQFVVNHEVRELFSVYDMKNTS